MGKKASSLMVQYIHPERRKNISLGNPFVQNDRLVQLAHLIHHL